MLSRLWYIVLAALVATALMATMLAQNAYNRSFATRLSDDLVRDRTELELWLRLEARTRLDAIAPLAANGDVRTALAAATDRRDRTVIDSGLRIGLERQLTRLNDALQEGKADILFAVDLQGQIIGQVGGTTPPPQASLEAFPVVARALQGYATDDVWTYNEQLYRVATHPVAHNGRYVGAIIHTAELNQIFAERLAGRIPGASVAFFVGERVVATSAPANVAGAPGTPEFTLGLPVARADAQYVEGNATAPLALGSTALGIFAPVTGTATHVGAGYAVGRPLHAVQSPTAVFDNATPEDRDNVPLPAIIVVALVLGLLGILFTFLEQDRPLKKLRAGVRALSRRELDRLDIAAYAGGHRLMADHINTALDKVAAEGRAAAPRVSANLDEILGAAPAERESVPYFGFATEDKANASAIPQAPAASPVAPRAPAPAAPAAAAPAAPAPAAPPAAPAAPAPAAPAAAAPAAPAPAAPPATPPAKAPAPPATPPAAAAVRPAPPAAPPAPVAAAPLAPAAPLGPQSPNRVSFDDDEDDDDATMVASIPHELLAQSSSESAAQEEERHFREVFDRFVALKQECGESTAGLTFDKFVVTLEKNRDTILSRHEAARVRFTVYTKAGKAALKATPLKE